MKRNILIVVAIIFAFVITFNVYYHLSGGSSPDNPIESVG